MSMPCSSAIFRTSGLDFVRRKSSADVAPHHRLFAAAQVLAPSTSRLISTNAEASLQSCRRRGARRAVVMRRFRGVRFARSDGAQAEEEVAAGAGGLDPPHQRFRWWPPLAQRFRGRRCLFSTRVGCAGSDFAPSPSSTATTVFTSTVSPSLCLMSVSVPAAG